MMKKKKEKNFRVFIFKLTQPQDELQNERIEEFIIEMIEPQSDWPAELI